jgi:hypothetical protein
MATWTTLPEQTVRISARVTSFTVVCDACAQSTIADGYGGAIVHGSLPLERHHGRLTCPNGHELLVERSSH